MKNGHEMLWFLRGSFSESELPLSDDAKVTNARGYAHSINWVRDQPFEQGMKIYIYIYIFLGPGPGGTRTRAEWDPDPGQDTDPGRDPPRVGPGPVGPEPVLHTYSTAYMRKNI